MNRQYSRTQAIRETAREGLGQVDEAELNDLGKRWSFCLAGHGGVGISLAKAGGRGYQQGLRSARYATEVGKHQLDHLPEMDCVGAWVRVCMCLRARVCVGA